MEAENNNNQSIVGDPEHGGAGSTKQPGMKRRRQNPLTEDDDTNLLPEDSFNIGDELRKIYEKMNSQNVELGTLKTENRVLMEKNNTLMAKLETMEQKLEVAELKARLASEQMGKMVDAKIAEATGKMREELCKLANEQMAEATTKLEEKQSNLDEEVQQKLAEQLQFMRSEGAEEKKQLQAEMQEFQRKFSEQQDAKLAEMDSRVKANLENIAKQLDKKMADFGEKMAFLESQASDSQKKLEEFARKLTDLEAKENEKRKEMELWKNNQWEGAGHVQNAKKNPASWTNIRARLPISRAMLTITPGRLVYYEVLLRLDPSVFGFRFYSIGWVGPDFVLNSQEWVGNHAGSYAINGLGKFVESGLKVAGYAAGFRSGDVVGSGLLLTQDGRLKLFFTKNGRLNGKPIVLSKDIGQDLLFYPAASFSPSNATSVEANFGADPGKPFRFDLEAHRTQLFN